MIYLRHFYFFITVFVVLNMSGQSVYAEVSVGANLSVEYANQSFSDGDADLSTLSFSPNMATGNWYFAIDIPWQKVDGGVSQYQRPRLDQICSVLNTGRTLPPRLSNLRNSILQYCNAQAGNDGSGLSDISVVASYGFGNGDASAWFSSLSLTYQSDNGETDKGLGNGTQDAIFEWTLQGDHAYISTSFSLGYNLVLGGKYEDFYDDYALVSFSLSSPIHKPLVFGASYQFQQASAEHLDDLSTIDLFSEFDFKDHYTLRLSYMNYLDADFYPDYSIGAAFYVSF